MPGLCTEYDVCLLDLDGVVYIGPDAAPFARDSLRAAREAGMRLAFVTNNASRPPETVAQHLRDLGIQTETSEVVTSAQAAARMVAERVAPGAPVLVVGGAGLVEALRERGLKPVDTRDDDPVAVVQGFDPSVNWTMLAEGAFAVGDGLPWIASNADMTIPTARGIAPGNGALVNVIALATGRSPEVAGKPEPPMHTETVLRTGARRPLVVGDRLDTDIEGANRSGVDSLAVLTGIATPDDLVRAASVHQPTYVGPDLRALAAEPAALIVEPGRTTYGTWQARIIEGSVRLVDTGGDVAAAPWPADVQNRLDGLRAVCSAVWTAQAASDHDPDHVEVGDVAGALTAAGW